MVESKRNRFELGGQRVFTLVALLCLSVFSFSWATPPPQDSSSYRGDINGDFVVTLSEVVAVRDLTSLKPVDCTAVVPGTASTCDTMDLNGDGVVTLADVVATRDLTSLKPYATPDGPWILDISGVPANVTGSASIQAAITNISGIGRPGIAVSFSIAAGPATLSGREYNPADDGIRDHASPPGATQVLAITTTDFPGDQTGATELTIPNVGTPVELTCTGFGTVTLNVEVLEDTLKSIPALSASPTAECSTVTECEDTIDNDGDTLIDYPDDPGCTSAADTREIEWLTLIGFDEYTPSWGYSQNIFIEGNFAYVLTYELSFGGSLQVIDISDPTAPFITGNIGIADFSLDVYVSGNYAYIANASSGLLIVDVSNPYNLSVTGSYVTPDWANGVFIVGNYAYIADSGTGLMIVDISDPANPFLEGSLDTPGSANEVFVDGSFAYIADDWMGLQIIDVSDPSFPVLAGYYDTPDTALDIFISGNNAYVADGDSGLQVIDISNPVSPFLNGTYNTPTYANSIFTSGNYAFVHDTCNEFLVIDVSNPTLPALVTSFYTRSSSQLYLHENYLYLPAIFGGVRVVYLDTLFPAVTQCNNGINDDTDNVIDYPDDPGCLSLSDSAEIGLNECDDGLDNDGDTYTDTADEGCYNNPEGITETGACQDGLDNDGDTLIDYPDDPGCTAVSETSEIYEPMPIGSYDTPGNAVGIYVDGGYAYIADGVSGLQIIDITSPTSPVYTSSVNTPGSASEVFISGNYAYVADGISGLQIVKITNPNSPTLMGAYDTPHAASGVFVVGNYAYVADGNSGLQIIRVTNKSSPSLVGTYDTPNYTNKVYVNGNYAYVADGTSLQIIDVSSPSSPVFVGSYDTFGYALDVYFSGSYAYVAEGYNLGPFWWLPTYLEVIDVSDPVFPSLTWSYETIGNPRAVFVDGNYAFMANYDYFEILNTSNPSYMYLAAYYSNTGIACDVYIAGSYAYIASSDFGLQIYNWAW